MNESLLKPKRRLSAIMESPDFKINNFDFIRFFAAFLVIVSHSFPLSYGNNDKEPLFMLTSGESTLGAIAVNTFFVISGFLITLSYVRSKNTSSYLIKRALRIYPALIVVVFLTVFLFGPLVTKLATGEYFRQPLTYHYLRTMTVFDTRFELPGLFLDNPYKGVVNGSLWSLRYELFFYVVVAVMGLSKLLNKWTTLAGVIISFIVVILFKVFSIETKGILYIIHTTFKLFMYYGAGMLVYFFRDKIVIDFKWFVVCLIPLIAAVFTPLFSYAFLIFGTYILFYLGLTKFGNLHRFSRYGDFSYGLYIYAFPIQQLVILLLPSDYRHWWLNTLIATPAILLLSVISWHVIEKNAMKLKKRYV